MVLPANGCATMVMDRDDYDKKFQGMLDDENTYRKLEKDPTPGLGRWKNSRLLALHKRGALSTKVYEKLWSSISCIRLIYGPPRMHKPGTPLCPIVSFVSSPMYQLSKHLSSLHSSLVGRSSSLVQNSKAFADFTNSLMLTNDETLVSFDVVSLFMSVPTDLAANIAQKWLLAERTGLEVEDIVALLKLCLNATFMCFSRCFYQQCFGTALVSPVSMTVANLVMEETKEKVLSTFSPASRFWKRYVDAGP